MGTLSVLGQAVLVLIIFSSLPSRTCIYAIVSSGATDESCVSLQLPGSSPQDPSTNPYTLTVYSEKTNEIVDTYIWNETLKVSIRSYPQLIQLRGILLQARNIGSTDAVGDFVNIKDGFQYVGCSGSPRGTITSTGEYTYYKFSFLWTPGGRHLGDIEFLVTVENTQDEYWTFGSGVIAVNDTTESYVEINCPADIVVTSLPETNGNNVSWSSPSCIGNTGDPIDVTCNETNNQFAPITPAKTVQCRCAGNTGSVETCIFHYTVQDISPPVISDCPSGNEGLFFYLPSNQSKVNAAWIEPSAVDNSGKDVTVSHIGGNSGDLFVLGITAVTYTFSDSSGNSNRCIFNVTVLDNIPPDVRGCEHNNRTITKHLPPDQSVINVTWAEPFATDNSAMDVELKKSGGKSGDLFPLGTSSVEYIFTDTSGNSAVCSFEVNILDDTTESYVEINCPADIVVASLPETNGNNVSWSSPSCINNTGDPIDVTCNEKNNQFVPITPAKTVQCWCASNTGSVETCNFHYTVQDISPPLISDCPRGTEGLFFYLPSNQSKANATWIEPSAVDNSGRDVSVSHIGGNSGDLFVLGTTTVTYTFSDSNGNSNRCIFNVTVLDNIPPAISGCEHNNRTITKHLPPDQSVINVTWAEPFATDNSAMDVELKKTGGKSGDLFPLGTSSVEYIFTDTSGNSAMCSFEVNILDITPPIVSDFGIKNGTRLEARLPDDSSEVVVSWTEPRATDNSEDELNISFSGGRSGDHFPLGITTIRYVFTDSSGNSNQYMFYIDVIDVSPPKITCPYQNEVVPAYLPANESEVNVPWIDPYATDNSGQEVHTELLRSRGTNKDAFTLGVTNITYTFTDTSGNSDQCSFHIVVTDRTPPMVRNCVHANSPLEVYLPSDGDRVKVTWTEPTGSDNSGMPVAVNHSGGGNGDLFPLGRTTVRYTFTDTSGNNQFCVFDVLVLDITPPVIMNCPSGDIEESLPVNSSQVMVSWADPNGTDNSALNINITITGGRNGGFYYHGKTEITYTFTDSSGNQNQCIFNVTVVDVTAPAVEYCPGDIQVSLPFNHSNVSVKWKAPSVLENSGDAVKLVQSGGNIGDFFPLGVTSIIYKFYDSSENYNECRFYVIVRDVTAPAINNCPIVVITSTCDERENVAWHEPTARDNSNGPVHVKTSEKPGDSFTVGNHTVIYTFEDESGNNALCSFIVQVEKKTQCTDHLSYIYFVAIGFYLMFLCLASALCVFLFYRRRRNTANYTLSRRYQALSEPEYPNSTLVELDYIRNTDRNEVERTRSSDVAAGGMDQEFYSPGYVDLEKPKKFNDAVEGTRDSDVHGATGGIDPDLLSSGYVDLEKPKKFYDS